MVGESWRRMAEKWGKAVGAKRKPDRERLREELQKADKRVDSGTKNRQLSADRRRASAILRRGGKSELGRANDYPDEVPDDLQQIDGIDAGIEDKLNALGIYRFYELATVLKFEVSWDITAPTPTLWYAALVVKMEAAKAEAAEEAEAALSRQEAALSTQEELKEKIKGLDLDQHTKYPVGRRFLPRGSTVADVLNYDWVRDREIGLLHIVYKDLKKLDEQLKKIGELKEKIEGLDWEPYAPTRINLGIRTGEIYPDLSTAMTELGTWTVAEILEKDWKQYEYHWRDGVYVAKTKIGALETVYRKLKWILEVTERAREEAIVEVWRNSHYLTEVISALEGQITFNEKDIKAYNADERFLKKDGVRKLPEKPTRCAAPKHAGLIRSGQCDQNAQPGSDFCHLHAELSET